MIFLYCQMFIYRSVNQNTNSPRPLRTWHFIRFPSPPNTPVFAQHTLLALFVQFVYILPFQLQCFLYLFSLSFF
jgi:hypothetical protein